MVISGLSLDQNQFDKLNSRMLCDCSASGSPQETKRSTCQSPNELLLEVGRQIKTWGRRAVGACLGLR
jgi:hypothetical protein